MLETPESDFRRAVAGKEISDSMSFLEKTLEARKAEFTPEVIEQRKSQVRRNLVDQLILPDQSKNYAAARWRSFDEMMRRVVNLDTDVSLIPDVDQDLHESTADMFRRAIIQAHIEERVQHALGENVLTKDQLDDCFTNVSPDQIDTISTVVGESGLTIYDKTPKERWRELSQRLSNAASDA